MAAHHRLYQGGISLVPHRMPPCHLLHCCRQAPRLDQGGISLVPQRMPPCHQPQEPRQEAQLMPSAQEK